MHVREFARVIRSLVRPFVDSLVRSIAPVYSTSDYINNGGFDSGSSWTINNDAWLIAGGLANGSASVSGDGLAQSFKSNAATTPVALSFYCVENATGADFTVRLTLAGTPVQTIYTGQPTSDTIIGVSAIAEAAFDGIRLEAVAAFSPIAIDDVSLRI